MSKSTIALLSSLEAVMEMFKLSSWMQIQVSDLPIIKAVSPKSSWALIDALFSINFSTISVQPYKAAI